MKERPILFSAPMVRALLAGTKTQTRRVLRDQNPVDLGACKHGAHLVRRPVRDRGVLVGHRMVPAHCPYGEPGGWLWVKETHYRFGNWVKDGFTTAGRQRWRFRAKGQQVMYEDAPPAKVSKKRSHIVGWYKRPSIFMHRWASRIALEVVAVRVERLCEISEADAIAEGVPPFNPSPSNIPRLNYSQVWEAINGKGSWNADPWVWCVEFRRVMS